MLPQTSPVAFPFAWFMYVYMCTGMVALGLGLAVKKNRPLELELLNPKGSRSGKILYNACTFTVSWAIEWCDRFSISRTHEDIVGPLLQDVTTGVYRSA